MSHFSEEAYDHVKKYLDFMERREYELNGDIIETGTRDYYNTQIRRNQGSMSKEKHLHLRMYALGDFLCSNGLAAQRLWDRLREAENELKNEDRISELKKQVEFLQKACEEREERIIELQDNNVNE